MARSASRPPFFLSQQRAAANKSHAMSCSPMTIQPCQVDKPRSRTDSPCASSSHPVPGSSDRSDKAGRRLALPELVKSQTTRTFAGPCVAAHWPDVVSVNDRQYMRHGERQWFCVDVRQDCTQPLLLPVESHEARVEVRRWPSMTCHQDNPTV